MFIQANAVLAEIRAKMKVLAAKAGKKMADKEDEKGVAAAKKISTPADPAVAASKPEDMETIDALDRFMAESIRHFVGEKDLGMDEEAAFDFFFALAEAGTEAGHLPPLPEAAASEDEVEVWIEAATKTGFTLQGVIALREAAATSE